uniref:UFSP1/2/DUB catalytic domain-containing protein n=1 Tax=Trichuris muris TaxID=70415 RepID=A0A5S6QDH9_TRIMR
MLVLHESLVAENEQHFVEGVISWLRQLCVLANSQEVNVCAPMLFSSVASFDFTFGCGYRNIQMIFSCLATRSEFRESLFKGFTRIPAVPQIQEIIERAWDLGLDSIGRRDLEGTLKHTQKWIGTEEVLAFFALFRIKYFERGAEFMPPLYLQEKGHSRLIVGMEKDCDGNRYLLICDPALDRSHMELLTEYADPSLLTLFRAQMNAFAKDEYQIMYINGLMKNDSEFERAQQRAYFETDMDEPCFQ